MCNEFVKNAARVIPWVVVVGLALSAVASAQSGTRYGLKIGITMANVTDEIEEIYGETETRYGVTLGGYASIPFFGPVYIQPEFLISQRGANSAEGVDDGVKLSYIDIPLLLNVKLADRYLIRPGFYVGPAINLLTGSEIEFGEVSVDIGEDVTNFDFSMIFGVGVDIRHGEGAFTFEGRYTVGFESIDDRRGEPADIRNRSVSIMVGYLF